MERIHDEREEEEENKNKEETKRRGIIEFYTVTKTKKKQGFLSIGRRSECSMTKPANHIRNT